MSDVPRLKIHIGATFEIGENSSDPTSFSCTSSRSFLVQIKTNGQAIRKILLRLFLPLRNQLALSDGRSLTTNRNRVSVSLLLNPKRSKGTIVNSNTVTVNLSGFLFLATSD